MNDHPVLQVRMIRRLLCAKTYQRLLIAASVVFREIQKVAGLKVFNKNRFGIHRCQHEWRRQRNSETCDDEL
jgi:hypothetical protein